MSQAKVRPPTGRFDYSPARVSPAGFLRVEAPSNSPVHLIGLVIRFDYEDERVLRPRSRERLILFVAIGRVAFSLPTARRALGQRGIDFDIISLLAEQGVRGALQLE